MAGVHRRLRIGFRALAVLLSLAALASAAAPAAVAGKVTLYRDTWGVPHIYGEDAAAAMFGHGYAQAEDRLDDLLGAYLGATGKAAAVFGEERLEEDYVARVARHEEVARERYSELSGETRLLIESFVAGVRAYMSEHPEKVPAWAERPQPHQVVALFRAFSYAWPFGQARGDLRRAGSRPPEGRRSNQIVIGPSRSAEGVPIAVIDPHLSWAPVSRFYEAHVHGGDLDFYGFSIIGTPVMALGHTDVFSLALTTGGPDCADVYEERMHPEDPTKYEYDGKWRSVSVEEIEIEVGTGNGTRVEKRRVERTHHGPLLARDGDRAYAARTAYDDQIGLVEQWLAMARADNLGEFLNAMRLNQSLPQNVMYADVYGNTYYVRAGRVPVRPEGHRWDRPVPGWTSETEWRGVHPLSDLVQIINPSTGYMQNCNVSPGTMMPGSPLTADRYPAHVYNSAPERSNSRGRRALELLAAKKKLTVEDVIALAMDTYVDRSNRWQQALADAYASHGERFANLKPAVELLSGWNGRIDVDNRAAPLFRSWMRACRKKDAGVSRARVEDGEPLDENEHLALLRALGEAVEEMTRLVGRIDVAWGEVARVRRGDRSWHAAGCRADGISTLRSVRFSTPDEKGISYAGGGQFATTVVVLREGDVVSFSATPFGQSNDPASSHYTDQGEKLFAVGKLKPTWHSKEELLEHVESERTLVAPPRE
jgi:acyl-homoserine-lactone acylase